MRKFLALCVKILRIPGISAGRRCFFPRFQAKTAIGIGIAKVFLEMF
jgi:hypothetical protein